MQTIAQIVQHMRPGVIETMALDLANFSEQHERTIIISLEGNRDSAIMNWPRIKPFADDMVFLNKKPGIQISLVFELMSFYKKHKVDVVHTHHIGPLIYGGLAARLAGVKCIYTEHEVSHLQHIRQRFLRHCVISLVNPLLVADAETVALVMRHYMKFKSINIIHSGIETKIFVPGDAIKARKTLGLPLNVKLIGCCCLLEKVKGHKNLIFALSILPRNIHLALVGSGSSESVLRNLVHKLKLDERTHFLGQIDDMSSFYQSLNVFCQPSLNEGYSRSPLEAQACNIATVVTVGVGSETLCPKNGQLVPVDNYKLMAYAIRNLLRRRDVINSRNFILENGQAKMMTSTHWMK